MEGNLKYRPLRDFSPAQAVTKLFSTPQLLGTKVGPVTVHPGWSTPDCRQSAVQKNVKALSKSNQSKAITLQPWTGTDHSRILRLEDFKTWRFVKALSPTHRPLLFPQNSCYSFLLEPESPQGQSAAGGIVLTRNSKDKSGIESANFWLVANRNNTAIYFLPPIYSSLVHRTFANKQSELLALSLYKTQTSNSLCKLAIAHSSYIT
jgi:hypothetical protein